MNRAGMLVIAVVALTWAGASVRAAEHPTLEERISDVVADVTVLLGRLADLQSAVAELQPAAQRAVNPAWAQLRAGLSMSEVTTLLGEPHAKQDSIYRIMWRPPQHAPAQAAAETSLREIRWEYGPHHADGSVVFDPGTQRVIRWSRPRG